MVLFRPERVVTERVEAYGFWLVIVEGLGEKGTASIVVSRSLSKAWNDTGLTGKRFARQCQ